MVDPEDRIRDHKLIVAALDDSPVMGEEREWWDNASPGLMIPDGWRCDLSQVKELIAAQFKKSSPASRSES